MRGPEYSSPSELALPQDIESLLATGLSYYKEPHGRSTPLYNLEGHPDLLVRAHGTEEYLEEVKEGLVAVYSEPDYCNYVLPSRLFVVNANNYVVTAKVQGELLSDLLREPTPQLLEQTNELYVSLGKYLCEAKRKRGFVARDIYESGQYMYGTIQGDPVPKIRLVDLPDGARNLNGKYAEEDYSINVFSWINGLVKTENIADTTLSAARLATASVFDLAARTPRGETWASVFRLMLTEKRPLYLDDPFIEDLGLS